MFSIIEFFFKFVEYIVIICVHRTLMLLTGSEENSKNQYWGLKIILKKNCVSSSIFQEKTWNSMSQSIPPFFYAFHCIPHVYIAIYYTYYALYTHTIEGRDIYVHTYTYTHTHIHTHVRTRPCTHISQFKTQSSQLIPMESGGRFPKIGICGYRESGRTKGWGEGGW